ncbi:ferritin-like domain-containing protein [Schizophyllum fasciatum]
MISLFAVSLAIAAASAMPHLKRDNDDGSSDITDTVVLNYALTLEHLENTFYHTALANYTQDDFTNAGLPEWARGRFEEISAHEQSHVDTLTSVLGDSATEACEYNFPVTDPTSFAALSQVLEGVGTSAYAGAAKYLQGSDALSAAAVILSTEARHAAWVASAISLENPWSGAYDTALSFNEVYSLASAFIVSCPDSNPTLPFKAFPMLTLGTGKPGDSVSVTYANETESDGEEMYIAFFSGLDKTFQQVSDGSVTIPEGLKGTVYAVATNNATAATDDTTVAGPAILSFPYGPDGNLLD